LMRILPNQEEEKISHEFSEETENERY
jgi:hypothetical protein